MAKTTFFTELAESGYCLCLCYCYSTVSLAWFWPWQINHSKRREHRMPLFWKKQQCLRCIDQSAFIILPRINSLFATHPPWPQFRRSSSRACSDVKKNVLKEIRASALLLFRIGKGWRSQSQAHTVCVREFRWHAGAAASQLSARDKRCEETNSLDRRGRSRHDNKGHISLGLHWEAESARCHHEGSCSQCITIQHMHVHVYIYICHVHMRVFLDF